MEADAYLQFAVEEKSHWWFRGRRAIFTHVVPPLLERPDTSQNGNRPRILDLGCGTGGFLDDLERHGQTFGLDFAPQALQYCTQRGYKRLLRGHGGRVPLADASLDLVTAFDTIEHIPEEMETLAECYRILRPGGHLVISVPAYQWLYTHQDEMVHHQRRYTARDLRQKLRSIGFAVEKASYINFILFPVILPIVLALKLKEALIKPRKDAYFTNASIKVPRWVNGILCGIFSFERHVLSRFSIPAGHSLLVIARKPAGDPPA